MIVECKCQKYKFDIPNLEIPEEGKMVRCGFCDEEWLYQNMEPLKDLNPSEEILIPKDLADLLMILDLVGSAVNKI